VLLAIAILLTVFVLSPPVGAAVIVLAAVFEAGEVVFWRRFLRRYRVSTGVEALLGESVVVVEECNPSGRVRVRGELWNARASQPMKVGDVGRVTGVDGLTLEIARSQD
jgi:membrane protein implicated in regulation of membrane protease activity